MDEILTREEVAGLRALVEPHPASGPIPISPEGTMNLCASHEALRKRLEEAEELLRGLRNEASGCWEAFEIGLREVISNTNYNVMLETIEHVDAFLTEMGEPDTQEEA